MLILVTGGNGSGKSRFAERAVARLGGRKLYAATMIPCGEEGRERVKKHLRQRAGLGFETVECPYSLDSVPAGAGDAVLLEDVSNLLANLTFGAACPSPLPEAERQIAELERKCRALVAVTIGGLDGRGRDGSTRAYVAALNELNGRLARAASAVYELRGGTARALKGECPWIL